jgi:hypothetical protein
MRESTKMMIVGMALSCTTVLLTVLAMYAFTGKAEYYNIGNGIQATSDIEHGVVCYKTMFSVSCVQVSEGE